MNDASPSPRKLIERPSRPDPSPRKLIERPRAPDPEIEEVEIPDEPGVSLDDFYAYMPMHNYIFTPSRELWPGSSVNARIPPIVMGVDDRGQGKRSRPAPGSTRTSRSSR